MNVPILKIPFDEADADQICSELRSMLIEGRLAMGANCRNFEAAFAKFCGTEMALGTTNGTAALELICRGLDIGGASVAVVGNTFMATALAPLAAGAKIILVDCDPVYFQMCPKDLARKIRPDTKAVILVHLGGIISPNLEEIKTVTHAAGAVLIEDAAHAHGAEIAQGRAGSLGLAAAFSFYPTKVLTTAEGGMVTTSDQGLAHKMATIQQHGQERPGSNVHQSFGLNYRPSEIHALLGLAMMAKAEDILAARRTGAKIYDELLAGSDFSPVLAPEGQKPAYYKYMVLLPEGFARDGLKTALKEKFNISLAGEVYATAMNKQPFWQNNPTTLASPLAALPNCEMVARRQICLPLYPGLGPEAQEYVVDSLLKVASKSG